MSILYPPVLMSDYNLSKETVHVSEKLGVGMAPPRKLVWKEVNIVLKSVIAKLTTKTCDTRSGAIPASSNNVELEPQELLSSESVLRCFSEMFTVLTGAGLVFKSLKLS